MSARWSQRLFVGTVAVLAIGTAAFAAGRWDLGEGAEAERVALPAPSAAPAAPTLPTPPAAVRAARLSILAGGDVNLGRDVGQRILLDASYSPFRGIEADVAAADLAFVNLESPLSEQGGETRHPTEPLVFSGPPDGADLLGAAGVDIVSVANNHAWDYGEQGFLQTLDHLERVGVAAVGGTRHAGRQFEPTILESRGWSVAFFAVTEVWNPGPFESHEASGRIAWADLDRLLPALERARRQHDVVIVSYHGGREYSPTPAVEPIVFIRRVMAAGADAVFAHHPHVSQGIGWHGGRPAFYSLGNLVFGTHRDHPWAGRGYLARITFHESGSTDIEVCPYLIAQDAPLRVDRESPWLSVFASRLVRLSSWITVRGTRVGEPNERACLPVFAPPEGDSYRPSSKDTASRPPPMTTGL